MTTYRLRLTSVWRKPWVWFMKIFFFFFILIGFIGLRSYDPEYGRPLVFGLAVFWISVFASMALMAIARYEEKIDQLERWIGGQLRKPVVLLTLVVIATITYLLLR